MSDGPTTPPEHGSRPSIAEIELSALTRQCLDRCITDLDVLNTDQRPVNWHFTTSDARTELRHR